MNRIDPSDKTLVEQLRALAGVSADTNTFDIVREDGRTIHVRFSPGSTDSLDVKTAILEHGSPPRAVPAGYRNGRREGPLLVPRPMRLLLRKETASNREGKKSGVDHEIQTGDPSFDDEVFIDTLINDDLVRAILASPDTRAAILSLLRDKCHTVRIDETSAGEISLDLVEFTQPAPDQARGARIVDALVRLAASLPPLRASGEAPPMDHQAAASTAGCALGFVGLIVTPLVMFGLAPSHCVESDGEGSSLVCSAGPECCEPLWIGFFAGIFLSLPMMLLLHRMVRGKPNSSTNRFILQCATLVVFAELGIIVARLWR
ncbi:hypothetical protein [Polyangium sorediatum]|uniref:DUF2470 domain-containing protein n=1 Tax=Polyangium sorediatum TaxID=889274 RepID=A0ABT6P1F6_9BACT|nr:hypothetical protein [Polyangium sorediatum]MDI1434442.1 hypothetical protein [Polyangium sorediatum]